MARLPHIDWRRVLWLALYILAGAAIGVYVTTHPVPQALGLLVLVALWIFLGIPACCGLRGDDMQIQFLYAEGCPYNRQARLTLHEVMEEEGIRSHVEEVHIRTVEEAQRLGFPGSPTILINSHDMNRGGRPGLGCREYRAADGRIQGWPDKETIRWALQAAGMPISGCCG